MPQSYTPEFKKKIVRLHEEEGRTYKSITADIAIETASFFVYFFPIMYIPIHLRKI